MKGKCALHQVHFVAPGSLNRKTVIQLIPQTGLQFIGDERAMVVGILGGMGMDGLHNVSKDEVSDLAAARFGVRILL